jgi:hypothetical protein
MSCLLIRRETDLLIYLLSTLLSVQEQAYVRCRHIFVVSSVA